MVCWRGRFEGSGPHCLDLRRRSENGDRPSEVVGEDMEAHFGHAVEPGLHGVDHMLMLPAPDAPKLLGRTAGLECAGRTIETMGRLLRFNLAEYQYSTSLDYNMLNWSHLCLLFLLHSN